MTLQVGDTQTLSSTEGVSPVVCRQQNRDAIAILLGSLMLLIGVLGIVGHIWHLPLFLTFQIWSPRFILLPSAFVHVLLGIGVILTFTDKNVKWQTLVRDSSLALVFLIGLGAFSLRMEAAHFVISRALIEAQSFIPMSFMTAINTLLAALVLLGCNYLPRQSAWACYGIGLFGLYLMEASLFSFAGHITQIPILFSYGQSVLSTLSFLMLSGLLLRQALCEPGLLSPLTSAFAKIRRLSYWATFPAAAILIAGISLVILIDQQIDNKRLYLAQVLFLLFEFATMLLSLLVYTLSLRMLFFFEKNLVAAQELQISEERFRLLVSAMQDYAIYMLNPNGYITTWNEGAERIMGYSAQEIDNQHFSTLYTPEDIRHDEPQRQLEMARIKGHYETESWSQRKDGSTFWSRITLTAITNEAGQHIGYSKVTKDLTHQRQMEASLRSSLSELTNLKQAIDAACIVSVTNPEGRLTYVNEEFCRISRYSRTELLGQDHRIIKSDYHSPEFFEHLWHTLKQQQIWKGEICNRASDGSIYWVDTTIYPFFEQNRPLQYIAIHHDITPLKKAEQELTANAYQQKIVATLGQHALSGLDIDRLLDKVVTLTASALKADFCNVLERQPEPDEFSLKAAYGLPEETIGQHYPIGSESQEGYTLLVDEPVVVEDFRREERFHTSRLFQDVEVLSGLSVVIRGESPELPYGVLSVHAEEARVFHTEDITFLQAIANLVTMAIERKHTESILREFNEVLEKRVAERTTELEAAKQEAEAANRQKTRVLAFVSHDLKNPLSALSRFAAMILEEEQSLSEKQRTIVQYIADGIKQMRALVTDILDKARLEEGQLTLSLESIELEPFLESLKPAIESMAEPHNIQVMIEVQPNLKYLEADPRFLRQILLNLLSNATKYNRPNGKAWLRISQPSPSAFATLVVQDTGYGIPPEKIPRLFSDFFRAGAGNGQVEGTGLGLAFIKKLVDMHGGDIKVESEAGHGCRFTVSLPNHLPKAEVAAEIMNVAPINPYLPEASVGTPEMPIRATSQVRFEIDRGIPSNNKGIAASEMPKETPEGTSKEKHLETPETSSPPEPTVNTPTSLSP